MGGSYQTIDVTSLASTELEDALLTYRMPDKNTPSTPSPTFVGIDQIDAPILWTSTKDMFH